MKKGNILVELVVTVAVIAVVMFFFTKYSGHSAISRVQPQPTEAELPDGFNYDYEDTADIPDAEISPLPEEANAIPYGYGELESEYFSLLSYIKAYGGIALPPAVPDSEDYPQVNPAEIDTEELLGVRDRAVGYLPASLYAGTMESGKLCDRLLTAYSKLTVRLCGDEMSCLDYSSGQINVEDVALVLFSGDDQFFPRIAYDPPMSVQTYDSGDFKMTVSGINTDDVSDENGYTHYNQDILIVTTKQLSSALDCK